MKWNPWDWGWSNWQIHPEWMLCHVTRRFEASETPIIVSVFYIIWWFNIQRGAARSHTSQKHKMKRFSDQQRRQDEQAKDVCVCFITVSFIYWWNSGVNTVCRPRSGSSLRRNGWCWPPPRPAPFMLMSLLLGVSSHKCCQIADILLALTNVTPAAISSCLLLLPVTVCCVGCCFRAAATHLFLGKETLLGQLSETHRTAAFDDRCLKLISYQIISRNSSTQRY